MLIVLLGVDIVVAWMLIQGMYVYLGMVWHGLAGEALPGGTVETHGRQFLALRRFQFGAWVAIAVVCLAWLQQVRRRGRPRSGRRVSPPIGWWGILAAAAALGHLAVAILAADRSTPLDLGGPMQLLLVAEVAEIGAAVLAIVLVRRLAERPDEEERSNEG